MLKTKALRKTKKENTKAAGHGYHFKNLSDEFLSNSAPRKISDNALVSTIAMTLTKKR